MKVEQGKIVTVKYLLKDDEGEELDRSDEDDPLTYLHGYGALVPGLETVLEGRFAGENFEVRIEPEEGYGEWDEDMVQEVSAGQFEDKDAITEGMTFEAETTEGPVMVTVTKVEGDTVTIDANHPLAGVNLNFSLEVVEIRDPTDEEIAEFQSEED